MNQLLLNVPKDFPVEFLEMMKTWKTIHKSPYGHSYYSQPVDWNYKPHNSYRIADHWNFTSRGKVHCPTTSECPNNNCWTLAIYDEMLGKYVVIKSIGKFSVDIVEVELSKLELKRERGFNYIKESSPSEYSFNKRCKELELRILNSYFKLLQKMKYAIPG